MNKKLKKWNINDIEQFWDIYGKDGRLTDNGFKLLIRWFFYDDKQKRWHMNVVKQNLSIRSKIFSMIYRHPKGEEFVKEYPNKLGGRR